MNKKNATKQKTKVIYSQADFDELYRHVLENNTSQEILLECEKQDTKRSFDYLYRKEDLFWKQCSLKINPNYTLFINQCDTPIKNIKKGTNIIYPNVMATSRLEVHTSFLGKSGIFLRSLFEVFGNSSFTFDEIIAILEKDYPQISSEKIRKTINQYFRHFLCEQMLVLS